MLKYLFRKPPAHNKFTFIPRVGGIGFYRWNSILDAYVEEVD